MILSRIDIHGFKSFATPTAIRFDPGITAIVGPNGCGKSNVVDAVRWVIGEQRARILRSEKMDNIIFNGTTRRHGLGMAEVQLTVQNTRGLLPTEYTTVALGRRLYRSGDSEYLLNETQCRLRDIADLFEDTGMGAGAYSVIELRMIDDILSESPKDRRRLFEEAAGITKYKKRRAQALKKLASVRADTDRVEDLTKEIAKRVSGLKRQASKARRHAELSSQEAALARTLAALDYRRIAAQATVTEARLKKLRDELAQLGAENTSQVELLQSKRGAHVHYEEEVHRSERALTDHERRVQDLAAEVRLLKERREAKKHDGARIARERETAAAERTSLEKRLQSLGADLRQAAAKAVKATEALEEAQAVRDEARQVVLAARIQLRDATNQHTQLLTDRVTHDRQYDQLVNRIELLTSAGERAASELDALQQQEVEHQRLLKLAKAKCEEAREEAKRTREAVALATDEHRNLQGKMDLADQRLRALSQEYAATQAEVTLLTGLISGYDDFPEAIRFLAGKLPDLTTVSDVIDVSAPYRNAVAAALGPLASAIIVPTVQAAQQAMALLRDEEQGRAFFVALDQVPGGAKAQTPPAEHALLSDAVTVREARYQRLVPLLLGDWCVAENLPQSQVLLPLRVVAASGEWLDSRGILFGGSITSDETVRHLDRRERLSVAEAELVALKEKMNEQQNLLSTWQGQQGALDLVAHQANCRAADVALAAAVHAAEHRQQDIAAVQARVGKAKAHQRRQAEELMNLSNQVHRPRAAAEDVGRRITTITATKETLQRTLAEAEEASSKAEEDYTANRLEEQRAQNAKRRTEQEIARTKSENERTLARLEALGKEEAQLTGVSDNLNEEITQAEAAERQESAQRDDLQLAVRNARKRQLESRATMDRLEKQQRVVRREYDEVQALEREAAVQHAAQVQKLEDLESPESRLDGRVLKGTDEGESVDEEALREELEVVRRKLANIGAINQLALEEYQKEQARLEFMEAQFDDLCQAEATLLRTTAEINKTAAARFNETFGAIRKNFHGLFGELFGENTRGDLRLEDSDDPLESPIVVTAQPRGKRPISISQLSSGEKTLTAIALLFAIYQVKPSPFCFLDEVDAPLDEANVERFMRLIRRFSEDTQFILVTHNKRTMALADRLYGITMQEEGVSSLVGVRFEQALRMVA